MFVICISLRYLFVISCLFMQSFLQSSLLPEQNEFLRVNSVSRFWCQNEHGDFCLVLLLCSNQSDFGQDVTEPWRPRGYNKSVKSITLHLNDVRWRCFTTTVCSSCLDKYPLATVECFLLHTHILQFSGFFFVCLFYNTSPKLDLSLFVCLFVLHLKILKELYSFPTISWSMCEHSFCGRNALPIALGLWYCAF